MSSLPSAAAPKTKKHSCQETDRLQGAVDMIKQPRPSRTTLPSAVMVILTCEAAFGFLLHLTLRVGEALDDGRHNL